MQNDSSTVREIRVFLSSTFKDMQAERHYLLTRVFPEVREACESRGVGFTEIDLRWGITEQEAEKGTTVAVCLKEIDRCRDFPPFFIGFLGERYGWVPDQAMLNDYLQGKELSEYVGTIQTALDKNISVTELEFDYALEGQQQGRAEALFYLRSTSLTSELYSQSGGAQATDFYDPGHGKLEVLKHKLRASGVIEIDNYESVEAFGESVKAQLLQELDRRYPEKQGALALLRLPHENFASTRLKFYVPPTGSCEAVLGYCRSRLSGKEKRPALIIGEPGAGKSALMAYLARNLPRQPLLAGARVLDFHVGADGKRGIDQWLDDIQVLLEGRVTPEQALTQVPSGNEKWQALVQLLSRSVATAQGKPLILLLDGIERFDNSSQVLRQFQKLSLPDQVIVILSATPSLDAGEEAVWRYGLERADAALLRKMIDTYTLNYRKRLPDALVNQLIQAPAMTLPVYMRVVLEQMRVRSAHETLEKDIQVLLSHADVGSLFRSMLTAWDLDLSTANHPQVVTRAAQYLCASRAGLSERQLALLLASDNDAPEGDSGQKRAPQLLMSRVLSVLRPYLVRYEGREQLMHSSLQSAVMQGADEILIRQEIIHIVGWASNGQDPSLSNALGSFTPLVIAERIFQACELLALDSEDAVALDTLRWDLQKPLCVVACYQSAPATLMQAFATLGAQQAAPAQAIASITSAWKACSPLWFPLAVEDLAVCNQITHQFIDLSYNTLCEAWCAFVAELIAGRFDNNLTLQARNNANLAAMYIASRRPEKAERLERQVLAQFEAAFGKDHPEVGKVLAVIALARYQQGDLAEAASLGSKAYKIQLAAYPHGNRDLVQILSNLGLIYRDLGKLDAAEAILLDGFKMAAKVFDAFDIDFITLTVVLADTYCDKQDYIRARAFAAKALEAAGDSLPSWHPTHIHALVTYANVCAGLDKVKDATEAYQIAYAIFVDTAPDDHQQLYTLECNLGQLLLKQGMLVEAQEVLGNAVERSRHFPAATGDGSSAQEMFNQCLTFRLDQQHLEAELAHRRLMARDPATRCGLVMYLNNLAVEYKDSGQFLMAEQCFLEALDIAKDLSEIDTADRAIVFNGLAALREEQNRLEEAEQLFVQVLYLRESAFAGNDQRIAHSCYRLGSVYFKQERYEEAEAYLARGVATFRSVRKADVRAFADCLSVYGMVLKRVARLENARAQMKEAIALYKKCGHAAASMVTGLSREIHEINMQLGDTGAVAGVGATPNWWKPWTW